MVYKREQIEKAVKAKGYVWFEGPKDFDVNIVGIRNNAPAIADKVTNVFDDCMTLSFKEGGVWKFYCWAITTDPGTKAVKEFSNPNATIKVATLFSGIGAIEHSLKRLNLRHEIIFAGDISCCYFLESYILTPSLNRNPLISNALFFVFGLTTFASDKNPHSTSLNTVASIFPILSPISRLNCVHITVDLIAVSIFVVSRFKFHHSTTAK